MNKSYAHIICVVRGKEKTGCMELKLYMNVIKAKVAYNDR